MPTLNRPPEKIAAAAAAAATDGTEWTFPAAIPTKAPNWMAATDANNPLSIVTTVPDKKRLFKL